MPVGPDRIGTECSAADSGRSGRRTSAQSRDAQHFLARAPQCAD